MCIRIEEIVKQETKEATDLKILKLETNDDSKPNQLMANNNNNSNKKHNTSFERALVSLQTLDCLHDSLFLSFFSVFDDEVNTRRNENAKHQNILYVYKCTCRVSISSLLAAYATAKRMNICHSPCYVCFRLLRVFFSACNGNFCMTSRKWKRAKKKMNNTTTTPMHNNRRTSQN